jgi:uncharacterized repeat protein (TIGR02543 family)
MLNTTLANNYNLTGGNTVNGTNGTISKATYTGLNTVTANVKAGEATTGNTIILPVIPPGASYGTITPGASINGTPTISGNVLTFDTHLLTGGQNYPNAITVAVTGGANYNDYNILITINAQTNVQENTPNAVIDFINERLIGLMPGAAYRFAEHLGGNVITGMVNLTADTNGSVDIGPGWFGKEICINKHGVSAVGTMMSDPQFIPIPLRPAAPTGVGKTDTSGGQSNGTITGVNAAMEYRLGNGNWAAITGTTVTGLAAGTYQVRYLGTAFAFPSDPASVTIAPSSPPQPGTFTITFSPNGGTVSPTSATTGADGRLASLPTPSRSGYSFDGWFTATGGGTQVTTSYVFSTNTTIYAQWTSTGPTTYTLTVHNGTGSGSYQAGATVSIKANGAPIGMEFDRWTTNGSGTFANASASATTFTMPASNTPVNATYKDLSTKSAWDAAIALIEKATFTLTQQDVTKTTTSGGVTTIEQSEDYARYRLAELINELIKSTGFVITPSDIVIFVFQPAASGNADTPADINGSFQFRVTPSGHASAYSSGTITASPVGNEQLTIDNGQLRAWTRNGTLHVTGLTEGKPWQVYNLYGQLIYTSIVYDADSFPSAGKAGVVTLPLPDRGMYIIRSGNDVLKIVY